MNTKSYIILFCSLLFFSGAYFFYYHRLYQQEAYAHIDSMQDDIVHKHQSKITPETEALFEAALQRSSTLRSKVPDTSICKYTEHAFKELSSKEFYTFQERQAFFAELGIEYIDDIDFEDTPILDTYAKNTKKYQDDVKKYDNLTDLYGSDIAHHVLMPMSIRWLGEDIGHGIFAEIDLAKDGFIGVYGGQVRERALVKDRDYAWAYPGETIQGTRISLDGARKGNELRLINDGRDPNCIVKYIVGLDGFWHVCYVAVKDIKKGDQLLISYGPSYWDSRTYKYQELAK